MPALSAAAASAAFLLAVGAAAWHDVRDRRVPNGLVAGIAVGALVAGPFALSPARGGAAALLGAAVGLLCWLPAWWRGLLGAGDVKLFAAGGAWLGPALAWRATVLAALLGGVLALAMGLALARARRRRARTALRTGTLAPDLPDRSVPYAVPMALALAAAAVHPHGVHLLP